MRAVVKPLLTNLMRCGFKASNNSLTDITQLDGQLAHMENLETVYLEGNPLERTLGGNYRRKIMAALPQIGQIDAT